MPGAGVPHRVHIVETFRIAAEQHDRQTAHRHAHGVRTVAGVSGAEQFAVRVHVQPGRGHVPGHVSAEDIHDGRVLGDPTQTQTVETPVDRVGRADIGRRSRTAQQFHRQNAKGPARAKPHRRVVFRAGRVLPVRVRGRFFRKDTERRRHIRLDEEHSIEFRVHTAGLRHGVPVRLELNCQQRLFLRLRRLHCVLGVLTSGRRTHRGHGR